MGAGSSSARTLSETGALGSAGPSLSKSSGQVIYDTIQLEVPVKSLIDIKYEVVHLSPLEVDKFKEDGRSHVAEAWRVLNMPSWKLVKEEDEGAIYSMMYEDGKKRSRKIFKVVARLDHDANTLMKDFWDKIDKLPQWNTALMESHRVVQLDACTDITYQITNTSGSGLVTPRDFVNLRCRQEIEDYYIISNVAIEYPTLPKGHQYIRGENGISCVALQIDPSDERKSTMHMIVNTKLNGWIPQKLLEVAMIEVLIDYTRNLREHVEDLKKILHDHHLRRRKSA